MAKKKATTRKPAKPVSPPAAGLSKPAKSPRSRTDASRPAKSKAATLEPRSHAIQRDRTTSHGATRKRVDAEVKNHCEPSRTTEPQKVPESTGPVPTESQPEPTPPAENRSRARTAASMTAEQYERHKKKAAERQRGNTAVGQDIGPIPDVVDPERRERCRLDLQQFCLDYLPDSFNLGFSADHVVAIKKMEAAVLYGEQFALAMPRGSGKTTLTIAAVLWALVYGYRHYVLLVGATKPLALKLLKVLKTRLQYSSEVVADFPEVCYPCKAIGNQANKAPGQKSQGAPTHIVWEKETICLPIVADAEGEIQPSAGAVIECTGIMGAIRGRQQPLPTGEIRRPDMCVVDDPQTKRSAASAKQIEDRLEVIDQDILGLPGPKDTFCAFVLCTVIRPDDVADQLLNVDDHPEWQGERIKAVRKMPDDMAAWQECWEVECEGLRTGIKDAGNKHYIRHRAQLDAGCEVYWEARYDQKRVSAIQHWMYFFFRSVNAFNAEAQQEPTPPIDSVDLRLTEDELLLKQHHTPPHVAPAYADKVTGFIDVGDKILWWCRVAWRSEHGTGYIIDYGTWPEQKLRHFRSTDSGLHTLAMKYRGRGIEAAIKAGVRDCLAHLMQPVRREDGAELTPSRLLVDGSDNTQHVKDAVATSGISAAWVSFGRYYGASATPIGERDHKKPGIKRGDNWQSRFDKDTEGRGCQCITFDSNHYKTWTDARLDTSIDEIGSLSLPKLRPESHSTFAKHCRAERRSFVFAPSTGRSVWEYKNPPDRPDNHWWDALVGNSVAASEQKVKVPDGAAAAAEQRSKLSVAERQKLRLMGRTREIVTARTDPDSPPTAATPETAPTAATPAAPRLSAAERQRRRLQGAR